VDQLQIDTKQLSEAARAAKSDRDLAMSQRDKAIAESKRLQAQISDRPKLDIDAKVREIELTEQRMEERKNAELEFELLVREQHFEGLFFNMQSELSKAQRDAQLAQTELMRAEWQGSKEMERNAELKGIGYGCVLGGICVVVILMRKWDKEVLSRILRRFNERAIQAFHREHFREFVTTTDGVMNLMRKRNCDTRGRFLLSVWKRLRRFRMLKVLRRMWGMYWKSRGRRILKKELDREFLPQQIHSQKELSLENTDVVQKSLHNEANHLKKVVFVDSISPVRRLSEPLQDVNQVIREAITRTEMAPASSRFSFKRKTDFNKYLPPPN